MHPVDFDYVAPTSTAEACTELAAHPGAALVLAGGMSLMPLLARRTLRPRVLIDIGRIEDLRHYASTDTGLRVGALATQRQLERSASLAGFDLLRQALPGVGTVSTRNRGTIVGSLAHADPAGQLGVCLLALGGQLGATSSRGTRPIVAADFFRGPYRTALRDDELLTEVVFERPAENTVSSFESVSLRGLGDSPLISVALVADRTRRTPLRLVVGGAGQSPKDVSALVDAPVNGGAARDVAHAVGQELEFDDDVRASAAHRTRIVTNVVARLVHRLHEETR